MKPLLQFNVLPALPDRLKSLSDIARNLWFAWNPEVISLFERLDREIWEQSEHNPVQMLNRIDQRTLDDAAADEGFLAHLERVHFLLEDYMANPNCGILNKSTPDNFLVAYFSAEYGIAECLPIYSGGLGILSGDHLKSASDLNLPFVAVGLMYQEGYFRQYLNFEGWQQEIYPKNDFVQLPTTLIKDADGDPLTIQVSFASQTVYAQIWRVQVGRVPLYLLDTKIEKNPIEFRNTTAQLYGGDREMRLRQEILLGIGGVRALRAMDITPTVYHMNEGHSAFVTFERIRILREEHGLSFDEAREFVIGSNVFTTHTPVPAGNDYFTADLMGKYFTRYAPRLGLNIQALLGYGRTNPWDTEEAFCMTVLALRLSSTSNAVSKLHAVVSRSMWREVWRHFPMEDVPILPITNGIHIPSWISDEMASLYHRYLGPKWVEDPDHERLWDRVTQIPDTELWRARERLRVRLVSFARMRLKEQLEHRGASRREIETSQEALNPEYLTLVFSRRFATYKRGTLLLRDLDRLDRILNNPDRPVQIIYAGKAHPQDVEGKEYIKRIVQTCMMEKFRQRIAFIEDYDIKVSQYLVQGADVWLNTPRRPLEACGTSGMKATANGGLNLSVLDGWWDEAYSLDNGWSIGSGEEYEDEEYQDEVESRNVYDLLEKEIAPLFYARRDDGLPREWIAKMKKSMRNLCPVFNSHRMVEEYTRKCYRPSTLNWVGLSEHLFEKAKQLAQWRQKIMMHWPEVRVTEVTTDSPFTRISGEGVQVFAKVALGELNADDVMVELYYGTLDPENNFVDRTTALMKPMGVEEDGLHRFSGTLATTETGKVGATVRVLPYHKFMGNIYAMGQVTWAASD